MDSQTATHLHLAAANIAIEESPGTVEQILLVIVLLGGVVSIYFWYVAIARLMRGQELIPYRRSECVLGLVDMIVVFVVWFGAQIATGVVLVVMTGSEGEDLFTEHGVLLLYLSAATGIASLLMCGGYLWVRYQTTNSFGLRFKQLGKTNWVRNCRFYNVVSADDVVAVRALTTSRVRSSCVNSVGV